MTPAPDSSKRIVSALRLKFKPPPPSPSIACFLDLVLAGGGGVDWTWSGAPGGDHSGGRDVPSPPAVLAGLERDLRL